MSKENVQKFNEFMAQNTEAQRELKELIARFTSEFAAAKGFEFTAEELAEEQIELSLEELDQVNGGGSLRFAQRKWMKVLNERINNN